MMCRLLNCRREGFGAHGFFRHQCGHGEGNGGGGPQIHSWKSDGSSHLVKQVLEYAQSNGVKAARQKVQARLETLSALGYSCSGFACSGGRRRERVSTWLTGLRVPAAAMPATARSISCPQTSPFAFPIMSTWRPRL